MTGSRSCKTTLVVDGVEEGEVVEELEVRENDVCAVSPEVVPVALTGKKIRNKKKEKIKKRKMVEQLESGPGAVQGSLDDTSVPMDVLEEAWNETERYLGVVDEAVMVPVYPEVVDSGHHDMGCRRTCDVSL